MLIYTYNKLLDIKELLMDWHAAKINQPIVFGATTLKGLKKISKVQREQS